MLYWFGFPFLFSIYYEQKYGVAFLKENYDKFWLFNGSYFGSSQKVVDIIVFGLGNSMNSSVPVGYTTVMRI